MTHPDELFQRAVALHREDRFHEAAALYREVARQAQTLNLAVNLGRCLTMTGDLDEARRWLEIAYRAQPDDARIAAPRLELGLAYLKAGDYPSGWPLYEERTRVWRSAAMRLTGAPPEWTGEPLDGRRLLVAQEQGVGDQLMAARFARQIAREGEAVTLACHPALGRLFARMPELDVLPVPVDGHVQLPPVDAWVRCMSLPFRLGVELPTLSGAAYLDVVEPAADPGGVGLFWRTASPHPTAADKSLPDDLVARLKARGVISLQPEDTGAKDFLDTAARIAALDLVITIDSAVAHLAGAMGKPVWILLMAESEWRWLTDRTDSPWYDSARLFRQPRQGDWGPVVDEVLARL